MGHALLIMFESLVLLGGCYIIGSVLLDLTIKFKSKINKIIDSKKK